MSFVQCKQSCCSVVFECNRCTA